MNFKRSKIRWVIALSFVLVITLAIVFTITSIRGIARASGPTITSDKADYPAGATVNLTGAGWASGEAVHIHVTDSDNNTWSLDSNPDPTADTNGGFTYSFQLPNYFVANYSVMATGPTSGTATTTFTDSPSVNLDQFANLPNQGWQNGDLNNSNSAYYEGSVVPFRLAIDGLSNGTHTIHLNYDFTAGGHEAYDFLASYNATEKNVDVCSSVSAAPSKLCPNIGTANTLAFPGDTFAPGGQTANGENVNSAIAFAHLPRNLSMWGGNLISLSSVTHSVNPPVTGDSSADMLLTFNTGSCNNNNCSVLIAWGGHLAQSAYWTQSSSGPNPGGPNGAGQVSGAPFHMRTQSLDGSGNKNQDRSIQPSAIVTTLTVNKILSPSTDPGLFNLLINGTVKASNVGNGGTTGAVSETAGTYTVSETAGTSTDLSLYTSTYSCVDSQNNVVTSGSGTSLRFNLIAGNGVTCTFTNTRKLLQDLTVTKTATPAFTRTYTWTITKKVDSNNQTIAAGGKATFNYTVEVTHDNGTDSGWTVTGKITVTNPNANFAITGVNVTDAINNGGTCTVSNGTNLTIPAGGSTQLNYTCSYASAPNPLNGTNTATATWPSNQGNGYLTPDGTASGQATADFSAITPTVVNGSITVVDDKTDPSNPVTLGQVSYTDPSTKDFTYALDLPGVGGTCTNYTNTAKINGTTQTASQKVKVCVAKDLSVSKTANSSFTRTYTWKIAKSVDKSSQNIASGGKATFTYTVDVTHDSGTDSAWTVSGTITVSNPNDFEDIPLTGVTDAVNNGATSCTFTNGSTTATVPRSGSVTLDYTCTYTSAPTSPTGTNTATATWNQATSYTPTGSASGTASVNFGTPTKVIDGSITVVDDQAGQGNPVTLGTADYTQANPIEFPTYTLTFPGKDGTCTNYKNTATFTTNSTSTQGSDSQTVKVCVGVDLTVSKIAIPAFTRTFTWTITKNVDKTRQNIAAGGTAQFNYTVTVTHDQGTDSAWTVSGTITVSNPNDWEDITADVTDAIDNGGKCTVTNGTNVTIPAGGSTTFDYICNYTSAPSPSSGTNTATATWDKTAASTPDGSTSGTATADFGQVTPKVVDGSITVVDDKTDPKNPPVTLGTADYTQANPIDFTYSLDLAGNGGTCTDYTNTATATIDGTDKTLTASQTVTVCVGKDLTVSKTASTAFTRTYTWGITKSVDQTQQNIASGGNATFNYTVSITHDSGTDSDWQVNGKITVTNPNDWEAITADVTDAIDNNGSCTVTGGTGVSVPASSSVDLPYSCTLSSNPGSGTNTATATWDSGAFFTPDGSAQGHSNFTFGDPTTVIDGSVTVTDSLGGTLGTVSYTDSSPKTFTYPYTFSGDPAGTCTSHDNTATFTTSDTSTTGSASASAKVCVGADLTVSKIAIPSFTRTYNWKITKNVDKTLVEQIGGGTATFNYTVKASETGFTDSAWQVTGTITITNPNDWEAIVANVTDDGVTNGGSCSVTNGTDLTVPANGSVDVSYSCTYSSAPSPSNGTNTATAKWDATTASTPDGSASGSTDFTFNDGSLGNPTTVNKTVTVTDTFNGGTPTTLGTLTATDTTPYASATYTYSHTLNVPANNCLTYPNTAKIKETGQTASVSVEVCGPAKTGALTMGFWQNKNGQGIISAANQAALQSWLKQFHPLSDAPSSNLATYVTNIIKSATCSGPATSPCNAMLRAQMLATALDVYFSDGSLGGNKIGASNGLGSSQPVIGSMSIDLTMICKMIDSSSGGSCSGSFENVSSAFGGATSMTVMNMLLYQNTNAADPAADAGAVWYGNIKATQVLAKDAFDAINNQVAFAP